MKKIIGILLVGLLGFSGCSSSEAENTSTYTVQAFGLVDEDGLSFSAYVMDQEGNLSSDAMITINDEPMNIGFSPPEDLNLEQGDNLIDAIDQTVNEVRCGAYQPYYFLNLSDVNEVDTVEFVAKGRQCFTLYSSSVVVPEKIRIIEPSGDEPLPAGEPVVVKWEGGVSCAPFRVVYYRGADAEMFSSGKIQSSAEFIMPAHWIEEGWGTIIVDGCNTADDDDQNMAESGIYISVQSNTYIEGPQPDAYASTAPKRGYHEWMQHCSNVRRAQGATCNKNYKPRTAQHYACITAAARQFGACWSRCADHRPKFCY